MHVQKCLTLLNMNNILKTKNVLIIVSLMLAFYLIFPTYAAVDTLIPENATTVTTQSGLGGLSPPPDEALFVPPIEQEAISPFVTYASLGLIAAIIVISGVVLYKKKHSKLTKACLSLVISGVILSALCYQISLVSASGEDWGNPLTTTEIGFFGYYYYGSGFTLNDTVPAWQSYENHGNYYDGIVRVCHDATGTNFDGSVYVDINVRVRADGWILAWLNESQGKQHVVYWGTTYISTTYYCVENATSLSRAMYRIFNAAGLEWVGYDVVSYYDYEFPTATKLIIASDGGAYPSGSLYFSIPVSQTVLCAWTSIMSASVDYGFSIDGNSLGHVTATNPVGDNITSYCTTNSWHELYYACGYTGDRAKMAIILWFE